MNPALLPMIAVLGLSLASASKGRLPDTSTIPQIENRRVKHLFESMRQGTFAEVTFPQLELSDVPGLLTYADSTRTLKRFPTNLLSSQRQVECSEGMVALWLVEGIRQGGKFPSLNALCFKAGVQKQDWTKASEDNHKEVAQAYRAWWSKAKKLPPHEAKAIVPLQGTNLSWY